MTIFGQWGIRAQEDAKLLEDRKYLEQKRDEMLKAIFLATEIYKKGFPPDKNGKKTVPWFGLEEGKSPAGATGLAAYMPATEMLGGKPLTVYKLGRDAGNKTAWIAMTGEAIMLGADQLTRSDDKKTHAPIFKGGSMARPPDDALLAMQQIGIARWGKVRIVGGVNFVQRSIEIAAKNGTWQNIANPELQARLHHQVRCESGADNLLKMMTGKEFEKTASIHEINDVLYARVSTMIACLKNELDSGSFKDIAQTEKDKIAALVSNIERFNNPMPGAFLDQIIKSSQLDAEAGMDMRSLLKEAVKIVSENPDLKNRVEKEHSAPLSPEGIVPDITEEKNDKTQTTQPKVQQEQKMAAPSM